MALSKNKIKYFNSLNLKKNRDNEQVFIAEGVKLVGDLLPYFKAKYIVATNKEMLVTAVNPPKTNRISNLILFMTS